MRPRAPTSSITLHLDDAPEFVSSFDRPNIYYQVIEKNNGKKQLLDFIRKEMTGQSGIVYCLSRKKVEDVAQFLRENGLNDDSVSCRFEHGRARGKPTPLYA